MSLFSKVVFKYKINARSVPRWYTNFKIDPGISKRKRIINSAEEVDDFEDLESDFMNVDKTHKQHLAEMEAGLEKDKFHIVRQKYFKEKHLNFLTWYDKEHIRYLHNSDPDEWTVEKLSEGFPALPEDIKKIIKSKWTINPKRIANHDQSVKKNWEDFKNGQIPNLPEDIVHHLNKFTNRTLNFKSFEVPQDKTVVKANLKPIGTEFSDIITSYNNLKAKNEYNGSSKELTVNLASVNINNEQINRKITKGKPITLDQLQNKLENRLNAGKNISDVEKLILKSNKPSQEVSVIELNENNLEDITKSKYETSKSPALTKKTQDLSHLIYPERIMIPKNQRKKGYTYKLNDCYYDDDGLFLYRVPGMY